MTKTNVSTKERAVFEETAEKLSPLLTSPNRFINRELSWLEFNDRVLDEAENTAHPLLERLRFLSISASNLNEFYMVRYAGLRQQVRANVTKPSQDGLTPAQQVSLIENKAFELMLDQQALWRLLKNELECEGIHLLEADKVDEQDYKWLRSYFDRELFPILTPQSVDPAHPFPFVPNLGLAIAATLENEHGEFVTGLVLIPEFAQRFIRLPDRTGRGMRFIAVEDVIPLFTDILFPKYREVSRCLFRVIRDSDIEIAEEAEDLVKDFEILLKQRRRGAVVQIKFTHNAPTELKSLIMRNLGAVPQDEVVLDGLLGLSQLTQLISDERPELTFEPFKPRYPERISSMNGDCFLAIRHKDIIVHHPYESFDVVIEFLRQAARDVNVVAIKQMLYRTTLDSPIVAALKEAAENGKTVTALVEIKARFDEEANLTLARDLERSGVNVVYGFIEYKTHAKASIVVRREKGELRTYTHFGTGNYHPINAEIYTDLSLFTADPIVGRDANRMFNYITANQEPPKESKGFEKVIISPTNLLPKIIELIENEATAAKEGKPAGIWAKMNALVDGKVIDALYSASQAGVPITLLVRGICCLRPGIKGMSETIQVKSIVGRFLEHSRILCFANGHPLPSDSAKVFISSADWMHRNFRRRVEALVPIENPTVHRQILNQIMVANINDDKQSWVMNSDGEYARTLAAEESVAFGCHEYFLQNPSLSGRGEVPLQSLPMSLVPRKRTRRE